jgi:hypothetical protein
VTVYGPTYVVSAPLQEPPLYSLLSTARVVDEGDDHWLNGLGIMGNECALAGLEDPCVGGGSDVRGVSAITGVADSPGFTVFTNIKCTTRSYRFDDLMNLARQHFTAVESQAVELELMSDPIGIGVVNLRGLNATPAPTIINATATTVIEGIGQLENHIATVMAMRGMIHVSPALLTAMAYRQLVISDNGKLRTPMGTLIVPGTGYVANTPTGQTATGTQEWAYATGLVELRRTQIYTVPDEASQAVDRAVNDLTVHVERHYAIAWQRCEHAAIKIDRAT